MDDDPREERGLLRVGGRVDPAGERLQHAADRARTDHQPHQPADGEQREQDVLDVPRVGEQRRRGDQVGDRRQSEDTSQNDPREPAGQAVGDPDRRGPEDAVDHGPAGDPDEQSDERVAGVPRECDGEQRGQQRPGTGGDGFERHTLTTRGGDKKL